MDKFSDDILEKLKKIIKSQSPDFWPHSRILDLSDCKALVVEIEHLRTQLEAYHAFVAGDITLAELEAAVE